STLYFTPQTNTGHPHQEDQGSTPRDGTSNPYWSTSSHFVSNPERGRSKLHTPTCVIPIKYQPSCQQTFKNLNLKIDPHGRIVTEIPVNQRSGDVIIPQQIIQNCKISET
ncbi:hypothetical protein ILUMI_16243, partial [Ignelater luminosus]